MTGTFCLAPFEEGFKTKQEKKIFQVQCGDITQVKHRSLTIIACYRVRSWKQTIPAEMQDWLSSALALRLAWDCGYFLVTVEW